MDLAIFALLSIGGFFYLSRFLSFQEDSLAVTTGPKAGGFSRADLWGAGILGFLMLANTAESFGKKHNITVAAIVAGCLLYLLIIIAIVTLLIARNKNPIRLFGLKWPRWRREIPRALLALLCVLPFITLIQLVMGKIYGPETAPQEILQFLINSRDLWEKLLLIFMAVVMAPLAEETIFRGYIFGATRQYLGRWPAILINSAIFALIHGHVPALLGLFVLAVFLSLVYERTGSLWAPIMLHAAFNSITIIWTLVVPMPMS